MSIDETVSFSLEINIDEAQRNIRRLETILYRTLGLMQRLGLPEDMKVAISRIQRLIAVLNQLRLALIAVQAARLSTGDPLAWAMAGLGAATFLVSAGDFREQLADDIRGA